MAGELITKLGVSGWVTVGTGISLTAGAYIQISASSFATLLADVEEDYPEFDIRVNVTSGTPTEGVVLEVHERLSDGTNQEIVPSAGYSPHRVGNVTCDNQTGNYYGSNMAILDKNATMYIKSNEASTALTVSVYMRAKSVVAAA